MDASQTIETEIGTPRGQLQVTTANRTLVRRWLVAKGWPAAFAAVLSLRELGIAYNTPGRRGGDRAHDHYLAKRLVAWEARQRGEGGHELPLGELPLGDDLANGGGQGAAEVIANNPAMQGDGGPTPEDKEAIAQRYGMDAGQMQGLVDKFNPDKNGDPDDDLAKALREAGLAGKAQGQQGDARDGKKQEAKDKAQQLKDLLDDLLNDDGKPTPQIDAAAIEELVRRKVEEELKKRGEYNEREIEIKLPDKKIKIKGRVPPWFGRVLALLKAGQNVLLVGPPGCGKSHCAALLAKAMDVDFGMVSGSAGASESMLSGWLLPVGKDGIFEYVPSEFVTLYERGNALFCLDELDAFDPNMMVSSNSATANGHFYVPHRYKEPCVKRGPNMMIIATANTYGTGGNVMFAGRNAMDATTLDRYVTITVDYDTKLEKDIAEQGGLTKEEAQSLWTLRQKVREACLRRVVSTRAFQKAAAMKACGDDWKAIMGTLTAGWTRDELAKAGVQ